jgi:hypothetical protein
MDVFFTKKAKQAIDVIADFVESKIPMEVEINLH